jgi:hypothetical protein
MAGFKKFDPYAFLKELEEQERAAAANNGQRRDGGTQIPPQNEKCSGRSSVAEGPQENENQDAGNVADVTGVGRTNFLSLPTPQNQNSLRPFCYNATPATNCATINAGFSAVERRCPDYIDPSHWHQAVDDGRRFLETWGEQAAALGWTAEELFGLHEPPPNPHPSYSRLSRYDAKGLVWMLNGASVVAMTETTAAIQHKTTGTITNYRKNNKPALGPLGDSLDDFI